MSCFPGTKGGLNKNKNKINKQTKKSSVVGQIVIFKYHYQCLPTLDHCWKERVGNIIISHHSMFMMMCTKAHRITNKLTGKQIVFQNKPLKQDREEEGKSAIF